MTLTLYQLYFGNDTSANGLLAHCASWHKSCHLKYNNDKPMKAIKKDGTALRCLRTEMTGEVLSDTRLTFRTVCSARRENKKVNSTKS